MYQPQNYKSFQYLWKALLCALFCISGANGNGEVRSTMCGVGSEIPQEVSPIENIPISMNVSTKADSSIKVVLELAIFCDMNFSSTFNYDMNAIQNYWTSYLLDTTLRYRTILSADISFLISTIVVSTKHEHQPYIEEAIAPDGKISVNRTFELFSKWIYGQMDSLPKFDVAIAVTGLDPNDEGGIVGGIGAACKVDHEKQVHYGTAVMVDFGMSYVLVGAHELGHLLGASHDELLVDFPECAEEKFIMNDGMGNNSEQRQYFFSSCSTRLIGDFVRSNKAECLRKIDNPESGLVDIEAPSRLEQCRRILPGKELFVDDEFGVCSHTKCFWYEEETLNNKSISLVDNTPCGNGLHCFRNSCVRSGLALRNVAQKACIRPENQFSSSDKLSVISCEENQDILTPLEKFAFTPAKDGGFIISTPYSNADFSTSGEKCLYAKYNDELISFDQCAEAEESWMVWDQIFDSEGNAFILKHRHTARCVKFDGKFVTAVSACNAEDQSLLWEFLLKHF